jgi:hypothetical protein
MTRSLRLAAIPAASTNLSSSQLDSATRQHASQALLVQGYALSVLQQPFVDFSGFPTLKKNQDDLNNGLVKARDHSNLYLNTILPSMINRIADIDAYFSLQTALSQAIAPGTDARTAINLLKEVQEQAQTYQGQAGTLVLSLQTLRDGISTDAAVFNTFVTAMNAAVNGDNGVLTSINDQLGSIDGKIAGAATGVALSGLAIAGGIFMILVGAIADFFTAGTSTPLVIAGVGVLAAGIGGEVGSALALSGLLNLKSKLLSDKSHLTAEVSLASGLASGFGSLAKSAAGAVQATQEMANAWSLLGDDLGSLVNSLNRGQTTVDAIRNLFIIAAQNNVKTIQADVGIIRNQLTGVQVTADSKTSITQQMNTQIAKLKLAA